MKPVLLIDFGSTYTKVTAADGESGELYATAQSFTTVKEDISLGLENALGELKSLSGISAFDECYACSSAAGGLRMVASGLVPSLTAEAARRAALGAGAKVIKTFAYEMTEEDIGEIDAIAPDIVLLSGGTDGGNSACCIHNANILASAKANFPVVLACNRNASAKCKAILEASGREVIPCENVMPSFGQLNIEPTQNAIRDLFLKRIISAKGLSKAQALVDDIIMPTPAAVLEALTLLSEMTGELMAVDLGGATTDVYSITDGLPTRAGTVLRGLPEPYAKRTVEGDIGMRYSARGIPENAGMDRLIKISGESEDGIQKWIERIHENPETLAATESERNMDFALASLAIETGLVRHAGTVETVYTPMGVAYQQIGKDLTRVNKLILTGGALIKLERAQEMALLAMKTDAYPSSLIPRDASVILDKHYILSAAGLLKRNHPEAAKVLLGKEFT
ncbi:MAG: glutamate mutase L [Clostridia bacterium]|nr:glutamate mutase L [Clostridia bacterium]